MDKKADFGIATLLIFVAVLLIVTIAAAILIQTAGSLQEKGYTTGKESENQIINSLDVIEISATDGTQGSLKWFEYTAKAAAGSNPLNLERSSIMINLNNSFFTLTYAGVGSKTTNTYDGYYTWNLENVTVGSATDNDYDLDGQEDYINGGYNQNATYLNMSTAGLNQLGSCNAGTFTSNLSNKTYVKEVSGICSGNDVVSVTLTPANYTHGLFSIEYIQKGENFVEGQINHDDIVKIFFEAPRAVSADEVMRINFVPESGTASYNIFRTPPVISDYKVFLFP